MARTRTARQRGRDRTPCDNRHVGNVQEVRIAKRTGFCYGVREAIDKAKEASAAGKATHTLGQVVHNEGVVRDLQDLGIQTVETLDDVDHGAAVVIRAHGVRPDVMERAEARGLEVIDGTCTWVIQEHRELVEARRGGLHDRPARHAQARRGRRHARLRPGRDRRRRGRGVGRRDPAQEADGAHQPVDPAALEVRAARGVDGLARPRAQDRQHRLPGDHPPPAGHAGGGQGRRPHGRRRRSVERQHQGADPAVRDRRDARDPDREHARPDRRVGVRGRPRRRGHRRHLDPDRGPARRRPAHPGAGRHARGPATTPPSWRRPRSSEPRRRPDARPPSRTSPRDRPPAQRDGGRTGISRRDTARRGAPGRRHRRSPERRASPRSSTGSWDPARPSSRTGRGRRATACTAIPSGTAGGS